MPDLRQRRRRCGCAAGSSHDPGRAATAGRSCTSRSRPPSVSATPPDSSNPVGRCCPPRRSTSSCRPPRSARCSSTPPPAGPWPPPPDRSTDRHPPHRSRSARPAGSARRGTERTAPATSPADPTTSAVVADSSGTAVAHDSAALTPDELRALLTTLALTAVPAPQDQPEPQHDPSAPLARLVRLRDRGCDGIGCSVPASRCELDHHQPWPDGPTNAANLTGPQPALPPRQAQGLDRRSAARRHHHLDQPGDPDLPHPPAMGTTTPHPRRHPTGHTRSPRRHRHSTARRTRPRRRSLDDPGRAPVRLTERPSGATRGWASGRGRGRRAASRGGPRRRGRGRCRPPAGRGRTWRG